MIGLGLSFFILAAPDSGIRTSTHPAHWSCATTIMGLSSYREEDKSKALEIVSKQIQSSKLKVSRGSLPTVSLTVKDSDVRTAALKKAIKRLEGLRWMLDPKSSLTLEQQRGIFVRVAEGKGEIKNFFAEFDDTINSVKKIVGDPHYHLHKTIFAGKIVASSLLGTMMAAGMYYFDNPSWMIMSGLVIAQSPLSLFSPFFRSHRKLKKLDDVMFQDKPSLLQLIEGDAWHMNNFGLFSFNDKISRQVVISLLGNPSIHWNSVSRAAIQTADLAEYSGPIKRGIAVIKDRWKVPTFQMSGNAVQVNPYLFVGYSKIYSDFLITNNPETHEPVLVFVTRIHLQPPLFPRTRTSPANIPFGVHIARPQTAREPLGVAR